MKRGADLTRQLLGYAGKGKYDIKLTIKELAKGTGLASTDGIVKGHGGYMDVQSERGQGTTFSIFLPASEKNIEQPDIAVDPQKVIDKTVLIVDDEPSVLDVGVKMLGKLGYTVLQAKSGRGAVEVFKNNRETIDIVVLDMIMPEMSGGVGEYPFV